MDKARNLNKGKLFKLIKEKDQLEELNSKRIEEDWRRNFIEKIRL